MKRYRQDLCAFFHQESVLVTESHLQAHFVRETLECGGEETCEVIGRNRIIGGYEMNQHGIFKKWLWARSDGILTILLCLIVSDDLLGLNSPPARSQMGHYVFWVSLIRFAVVIYKFVSWRYTLLNIPPLFFTLLSCL